MPQPVVVSSALFLLRLATKYVEAELELLNVWMKLNERTGSTRWCCNQLWVELCGHFSALSVYIATLSPVLGGVSNEVRLARRVP